MTPTGAASDHRARLHPQRRLVNMVGDNDSPENGPFHPFSRRENTLTKNLLQNRV
jgi:hypothetical protein